MTGLIALHKRAQRAGAVRVELRAPRRILGAAVGLTAGADGFDLPAISGPSTVQGSTRTSSSGRNTAPAASRARRMASRVAGFGLRRSSSKLSRSHSLIEAVRASLLTDQLSNVRAERHWPAVIITRSVDAGIVGSGFCFRDSNRRSLRPKISSAMVANIHKVAVRKTRFGRCWRTKITLPHIGSNVERRNNLARPSETDCSAHP